MCGREQVRIVAINEATAEVKYFLSNASSVPLGRLLAVAFCRWSGEHSLRLGKQEVGLMHYEGRDYTGLLRHVIVALWVLGFVATHSERLRGENPQVTAEQVCRARNQRCAAVFRRRRRLPDVQHLRAILCYHQRRNAQATKSHKKQRRRCVI